MDYNDLPLHIRQLLDGLSPELRADCLAKLGEITEPDAVADVGAAMEATANVPPSQAVPVAFSLLMAFGDFQGPEEAAARFAALAISALQDPQLGPITGATLTKMIEGLMWVLAAFHPSMAGGDPGDLAEKLAEHLRRAIEQPGRRASFETMQELAEDYYDGQGIERGTFDPERMRDQPADAASFAADVLADLDDLPLYGGEDAAA